MAAVEQLRVFAKILKIPLEVAVSHQDFLGCLGRHQEADLILIDTAGRSPKDQVGHDELMAITREVCKIETHLVLAAPVTESVQLDTIRRYQSLPIQNMAGGSFDANNMLHLDGYPLKTASSVSTIAGNTA